MFYFVVMENGSGVCFESDRSYVVGAVYGHADGNDLLAGVVGAVESVSVIAQKGMDFSGEFVRKLLPCLSRVSIRSAEAEMWIQRVIAEHATCGKWVGLRLNLVPESSIIFTPRPSIYVRKEFDMDNLVDVIKNILRVDERS